MPSQPPANAGSHEQFARRFGDYLKAIYLSAGQRKLVESLASELRTRSARRVLDCAAGIGFPSLDIWRETAEEFEIHYSDGDKEMIALLKKQATSHGLDVLTMSPPRSPSVPLVDRPDPHVLNWADLDELDGQYDYVLCRGNALAYADTWNGSDQVASEETLHNYIEQMIRRVVPGGYLHVDAPKTDGLVRTTCGSFDAETISIEEEVTVDSGRRRWSVCFRRGNEDPISFVRFSSLLTVDRLKSILEDFGLEETELIDLPGERPNFGVIIARKPV